MAAQRSAAQPRRVPGTLVVAAAFAATGVWLCSGFARGDDAHDPARVDMPVAFLGGGDRVTVKRTVVESFPGVMKGTTVMNKVLKALRPYGVRAHNTIYATSSCPDEINGDKGHLTTMLTRHFGHVFNLGGLGGVPFAGKTGFAAFSHHVPDDGHVVVVFGPHLGYTIEGEPGKFLRRGQAAVSAACGASTAAFAQNMGRLMRSDHQDMQQSWLRAKLKVVHEEIAAAPDPMVELVMQVYKIVEEEIMEIVNTDFGSGNLVLIGGVAVNMPYPMEGYFMPLHFSVRSAGQDPVDLLPAL